MIGTPLRIAVIGGGIGGLTAALALRQAGFEVEVYEQAPELTEVGGGINMAPNATRVLRRLRQLLNGYASMLLRRLVPVGWALLDSFDLLPGIDLL